MSNFSTREGCKNPSETLFKHWKEENLKQRTVFPQELGNKWRWTLDISIMINNVGICTVYLIIIGEVEVPVENEPAMSFLVALYCWTGCTIRRF